MSTPTDRYVYSGEEGMWVDTTKPWTDPDADEPPEEQLYEEVDAGETLNDQDCRIAELEAALEEQTAERDEWRWVAHHELLDEVYDKHGNERQVVEERENWELSHLRSIYAARAAKEEKA